MVEPAQNHQPYQWGPASTDVSTGKFLVKQRQDRAALHQELAQLDAAELLWGDPNGSPNWCPEAVQLNKMASTPFSYPEAERSLKSHYQLSILDGLGLQEVPLALGAAGGCWPTSKTPSR